ncbi:CLUMA_CG017086, isoform A [Clunio marinus]|uniref:CLUMA_CG017078, isoform A n=1 Tax=Clunio marinus TaxID=568069 RepID=A0A1J1IUR5_9DIPT|nr:CLUMA_CG017078, isoform A [Clunio marinus]CRL03965.1 CLUMA_CG017086, isoform A [Clunio marinus]
MQFKEFNLEQHFTLLLNLDNIQYQVSRLLSLRIHDIDISFLTVASMKSTREKWKQKGENNANLAFYRLK